MNVYIIDKIEMLKLLLTVLEKRSIIDQLNDNMWKLFKIDYFVKF